MEQQKRIIIVDDDLGIQDSARMIFERLGFIVNVFSNGEALLKNEFELPDVFILDKQLAGVDGFDICRFLKQQDSTRHLPVLMVSAIPHLNNLSKLAGADAFLEKPYRMKVLRDAVSKLLAPA